MIVIKAQRGKSFVTYLWASQKTPATIAMNIAAMMVFLIKLFMSIFFVLHIHDKIALQLFVEDAIEFLNAAIIKSRS